jgi:nicotinamidase-related amidase
MSTVLVLIDLQNDYFPGGSMELVASEEAVGQAARLLHAFRQRSQPVIHIQHIAVHDGATFFLPGTHGADIHSSVQPISGERVVQKNFPNSFRETTLLEDLKRNCASHVVFAGMMTQMCIDTTVRAASDLGFHCSLAHDGCATTHLTFGARTVDANDVQAAYLSALGDGFATIKTVKELCSES